MAENETLDIGHARSGRWRKWRDSILSQGSVDEIATEGVRCLARTFKNLQQIFENENHVPLKEILHAATDPDWDFSDIIRRGQYGRDYLQMFESQSSQGLDDRSILENVLTLTTDRFLDQIREDAVGTAFENANVYREFASAVKERMIDGIQRLASQMVAALNRPLQSQMLSNEDQHQELLLRMSIGMSQEHTCEQESDAILNPRRSRIPLVLAQLLDIASRSFLLCYTFLFARQRRC